LHDSSLTNNIVIVIIHLKTIKPIPMTRNSTSTMGALHPVMFFILIYGISLFMALLVCRAIYHSINGSEDIVKTEESTNSLSYSGGSSSAQATASR